MSWWLLLVRLSVASPDLTCAQAIGLAERLSDPGAASAILTRACAEAGPRELAPRGLSPDPYVLPPFPLTAEPPVLAWQERLLGPQQELLRTWLARGEAYREMMSRELRARGLPDELRYLSMMESGFNPTARSHVGAVGLWQLMPATARELGLSVRVGRDERRDPLLATRAAARLLRSLYLQLDDWSLTMAAYNCGIGCVKRAIDTHQTRDFWALRARGALPAETRDYVPRIIAAARVGEVQRILLRLRMASGATSPPPDRPSAGSPSSDLRGSSPERS